MIKPAPRPCRLVLLSLVVLTLSACGGSSTSGTAASDTSSGSTSGASSTSTGGTSTSGATTTGSTTGAGTSTGSGSSPSGSAGTSTGGTTGTSTSGSTGTTASGAGTGPAALLAAKLGKPAQLLVGLGGQGDLANPNTAITSQSIHIDIYERYLGTGDWTSWNQNPDYVGVVTAAADSLGAIPMFTQYQMANDGQNNTAVLNDVTYMTTYWARVIVLFKDLGTYGKPALVNLEPDFWDYMEQAATNGNPATVTALVSASSMANPDCAAQPNNVAGVAQCLVVLARKYAPKAYIGFPVSGWGGNSEAANLAWMTAMGAQNTDFIVEQTLDRDAGCYEVVPQPAACTYAGSGWYWDETNTTHPNFQDYLTKVGADQAGLGNLPVIWWQTPEGVPSTTPGGTAHHYRDNRVHYFLNHPAQLTAVGGLAVVFGDGENSQTNISTDGGQMATLDAAYQAAPALLP
jgi:hypothetical protein